MLPTLALFSLLAQAEPVLPLVPQPGAVRLEAPASDEADQGQFYASLDAAEPAPLVAAFQELIAPAVVAGHLELGPLPGRAQDHPEGYRIRADGQRVVVRANTPAGLARGVSRLAQLVDEQGKVPPLEIIDAPESAWRGLMLDVARFPHTAEDVRQAIQLAWLTGLNRVHLHLTDDQYFTFPSEAFPELASVAADGGRRHFTRAELADLVQDAELRGIQLVPEIDMPAHAGVMVRARPDLFGTTDPVTGEPRSTGVVNMASERAYGALDTLLGEVAEVFWNSDYIHLGADEVWAGHLRELPEYAAYCAQHELPRAAAGEVSELYCHFVARCCAMVRKRGKRPVVWEGFPGSGTDAAPIPDDILVMAWNLTFQSPEDLVARGYEIVNCGWDPLYVVPSQCWRASLERALDWTVLDLRQRYGGPEFTLPADAPVLGAQVCIWEQRPEAVLPAAYEIVAATAERMWNSAAPRDPAGHRARRARLDALVTRAFGPKFVPRRPPEEGRPSAVPRPVERYTAGQLVPPARVAEEQAAYDWRAAWPIPRGSSAPLDVDALGVRASGTFAKMTPERARLVNHELFARVAERGHVETRIPAEPLPSLAWLPRRQWRTYALELTGQLELPTPGAWTFFVRANDGVAELSLGGATVAVSRGNQQRVGQATLPAGRFDFRIRYHFEYVQNELNLMVQGPGQSAPVPFAEFLVLGKARHEPATGLLNGIDFVDPTQLIHRSLALGRPITSSAGHQGAMTPEQAVDGRIGNESGWHCGESPAALTIDLGEEQPLDRARLVFYHDGGRFYQYRLDLSLDGNTWQTVADGSANTGTSTPEGVEHRFAVTPARYARLTILKNSANPGVHVNEILLYADAAAPR